MSHAMMNIENIVNMDGFPAQARSRGMHSVGFII